MPIDIARYKAVDSKGDGTWFPVPADVFGLEGDEAKKLDVEFRLKHYPDKVLRKHSRLATKPFNLGRRRTKAATMNLEERFDTEKFRELKYLYVIDDFKGLKEENKDIECNDDNKMLLMDIFPDLADWVDEVVEDISNFIREQKESEVKNLKSSSPSQEQ